MLESNDRPTVVILDTADANSTDPSGGIASDLARYCPPTGIVEGVQVLRASDAI